MHSQLGDASRDLSGLCRALSGVAAPSGNEDRLVAAVVDHLRSAGLDPLVDRLGQVAVRFGPAEGGPVVLVTAHLDELGLTVRGIDADGMIRVHRLGGMPERVLPGLRLLVHTRGGDVPAIVGLKSHHLTPPEEKYIAYPATSLYLDVGATNRNDAAALGVRVGDPVTYQPLWSDLGFGRFSGKSLDDRLGVAVLLAYIDRLVADPPPLPVVVAFTTQEEFHVRGTLALAARFSPDVVINVDVAPATDTPDLVGQGAVRLGGGPTLSRLSFHGRGTLGGLIPHPALVRTAEKVAEKIGVPVQHDAMVGVITDAAFIPMSRAEGVAAVGVGIPVRYTHSPVETAQLSDVSNCAELVCNLAPSLVGIDLERGASALKGGGLG